MTLRILINLMTYFSLIGSIPCWAVDGGGGGFPQSSTKGQVHEAIGYGIQNIKGVLNQLGAANTPKDAPVGNFFSQVVPAFQNERLQVRTGSDRRVYDKRGNLLYTVSDGLCYDELDGRSYAVLVRRAESGVIDICLSEGRLSQVSRAEIKKHVIALLSFAIATGHGFGAADASRVQRYVLENSQ
jgi:hypothetical protein